MPTGAPTTSEWSTILLPTKVWLILEVWQYTVFMHWKWGMSPGKLDFKVGLMILVPVKATRVTCPILFLSSVTDKHYWTHGYVMTTKNVSESTPAFLSDLAKAIFVCGKSINLLRLCHPQVSWLHTWSPYRQAWPIWFYYIKSVLQKCHISRALAMDI